MNRLWQHSIRRNDALRGDRTLVGPLASKTRVVVRVVSIVGLAMVVVSLTGDRCRSEENLPAGYSDYERGHWSLMPRSRPALPAPTDETGRRWLRTPVDAFILERLRRAELAPTAEATKAVLARRLFFDLIGLPPTVEELDVFLADDRPDAYERLTDRLLASPQHGEHWGQHWLDVVRFGETEGFEYDRHRPGAWRYRDYVIASWNADKPFDRFLTEQLAGDELPDADSAARVAAGFHRLGAVRRNAGNSDVSFSRNEVLTEMTDAVGAVFLGLTLGCARCHDHKFDAIRQKDYYQMQAFLARTHERDERLADATTVAEWTAETDRIQAAIKKLRETQQQVEGLERERLIEQIRRLESKLPPPPPTISSVENRPQEPAAVHLLFRGDVDKKRELVGPRVLGVLTAFASASPDAAGQADKQSDGKSTALERPRTELARWLIDDDHPLTARVLTNRIWHYHFGEGLVATPNDFGVNGAAPSHERLLDDLANRLVDGRWNVKPLHRLLVTSAVYRQASFSSEEVAARRVDPTNQWLSRFRRRRLEAEQLRDAMLSVSGRLHRTLGGESVIVPVEQELVALLYKPSQWAVTPDAAEHDRRSIYLLAKRNLRVPFLDVFDQPDLQSSCARRTSSTHAPQALEMLNGSLANDLADAFAQRLRREAGPAPERQVELAFRLTAGRDPTAEERALATPFLASRSPREFALAMFNLNAFLYID